MKLYKATYTLSAFKGDQEYWFPLDDGHLFTECKHPAGISGRWMALVCACCYDGVGRWPYFGQLFEFVCEVPDDPA